MAAIVFNIAKGRAAYYGTLPLAADGLVAVLLSAAQADDALRDHITLGALLGTAGNTEATFTGYGRRTLSGVTVTVNNTTNAVELTGTVANWSPTTAQALVRILFCYDPDTAVGTDADLIPLVADDFVVTTATSGTLTYTTNAAGFYGAS